MLLASIAVAQVLTLVIPLGLFLLTLAWLAWLLHGRSLRRRADSWPEPPTTTAVRKPPPQ